MSGIWNYLWGTSAKNNVEFELIEMDKSSVKEILNKHLNSRINQLKLLNIINASNRIDVPQKDQQVIKIEVPVESTPIDKSELLPSPITIEIPDTLPPPITIDLPSKPEIVQCDRKVMLDILKERALVELFPEITGLKELTACEIPQTFKDEYTSYKDQQSNAIKNKQKSKKRKNH